MKKLKYPAKYEVHTPSGPTHACEKHAQGLKKVFGVLGCHIGIGKSDGKHECMNCINENKK